MSRREGVICVLKPPGMSSSDAVTDIRRVFNEKRVGHPGTLDPAAAGVLPICIGRATRLFDFLVDKQKRYIAEIAFGVATDTEDATGKPTAVSEAVVELETLAEVLRQFTGEIEQTPPAYSALNVGGVKLYKLARQGKLTQTPEVKRRSITIYKLQVLKQLAVNRFLIEIVCSKGTYIRTLCKDIGEALGVPAHMAFLLRTDSGAFSLEDSYSIAELETMRSEGRLNDAVIPIDKAIAHLPEIRLEGISAKKIDLLIKGTGFKTDDCREGMPLRVYADGDFLGIGEIIEGELKLTVWLGSEARQVKGVKLSGVVGEAKHIGSKLGFPTANLTGYNKKLLPPEGVYATVAEVRGARYRAITSIGSNPTFNGEVVSVETYMLDYSDDCYGEPMTVIFVQWLRDMRRFNSADELKEQLTHDAERSRRCRDSLKYIDFSR